MSIAQHVIEKCGGKVAKVAELAGTTENWVYRWRLPVEKGGTGGRVPPKAMQKLLEAAARGECELTPADFFDSSVNAAE